MIASDAGFKATLEGLEFRGDEYRDQPGIYVETVEGTLDGGTGRYESVPSGTGDGDGETDTPILRTDPRIIVMSGFVVARTMRELGTVGHNLRGLVQTRLALFEWDEFGESFRTRVRRGSGNMFEPIGSTGWANFLLRLRAPSQRIYGMQHPKAGPGYTIALSNGGNFPALNVFEITGNMPVGYRLVAGGAEYVVTQPLVPGQTHRINMRDRILYRNGVAQTGGVARADAIAVPANSTLTVTLYPNDGEGQITGWPVDTYL